MKAYWQLTLAQLKLFARNKSVIIWTTIFPLFLMIVLGLFLGGGNQLTISLAWLDEDQSTYSEQMKQSFLEIEAIQLEERDDLEQAKEEVEAGDLSFVVRIPADFGEQVEAGSLAIMAEEGRSTNDEASFPATFEVFYNEVDQAIKQLGFVVIEQAVDKLNKELQSFQEIVHVQEVGIQALGLTYLDFLVPGIAALMILSTNLNGVAAQISSWRERGILRRIHSTGLPASTFVGAQITARLILNGAQAILVLLVGIFILQAQMNGSWLLLLGFIILGTLVFMSIGFVIASLAKSPEHASPIAGFISFPMLFLGGIFFPISNMPQFLQPVVYALPISHLSEVLRQVMNVGAGLGELWLSTLILLGWFVVTFAVASKAFRWE